MFRRLLWRRLVLIALLAWILEAATSLVPPIGLAVSVGFLSVFAFCALVVERRAQKKLTMLIGTTGEDKPLKIRRE